MIRKPMPFPGGEQDAGNDGTRSDDPRQSISVDRPNPLYRQVKDWLVDRIRSGDLTPETRVPSENEIVDRFGVSRMTANRALRELTAEGYLVRIQGVGTFVARPKPQGALLEIRSIDDEITSWGGRHASEILTLRAEPADAEVALAMDLEIGAAVFHAVMVHRNGELPILYSDRYVNPAVAPEFLDQDFTHITPSQYLIRVAPVEEAEHVIEATVPTEAMRKLLKMDKNEPCLVMHRRTWSFGLVATRSTLLYPGSRYRLGGRYSTGSVTVSSMA